MVDKWVGKVAVVTGSSSGIGAAIFKDLAKNGIHVVGLARRVNKIEEIISEQGDTVGKAYAYKCDVSDPKSVDEAFKWIEKKFGVINILVNNAGIGRSANILDEGEEAFAMLNEVIDTNLRGLTQCTREAFRLMKKSDDYGMIININSVAGHVVSYSEFSLNMYPATKFAVTALTESIRQELVTANNNKVRVTSLSPGMTATDITTASGFDKSTARGEALSKMPTLDPADISHAVLFLLSTSYNVNIKELTIKPVGERR